jgi:hypothetical protein
VAGRASLCSRPCCHALNTRLFGCLAAACWGRGRLADRPCPACCPGEEREEGKELGSVPGEVLGFLRHGEPLLPAELARQQGKHLAPVTRPEDLCNSPCCLFDNMMIFRHMPWPSVLHAVH